MKIEKITILSNIEKEAKELTFKDGLNIIHGDVDTGKSTLSRSIMYTLGCDVDIKKGTWDAGEKIFILDITINEERYKILRLRLKKGNGKNTFAVLKRDKLVDIFYNTTEFSYFFSDLMGISMHLKTKDGKDIPFYQNYLFLLSYSDQDNSWGNYLTGTFSGLNAIADYKRIIVEYMVGFRSEEYYKLSKKKKTLNNSKMMYSSMVKNNDKTIDDNMSKIKLIESLDIAKFKEEYLELMKRFDNLLVQEREIKYRLNEIIYEINFNTNLINELKIVSMDKTNNDVCNFCSQSVFKTLEEQYLEQINKENIVKQKLILEAENNRLNKQKEKIINELNGLKQTDIKGILDESGDNLSVIERIESVGYSSINKSLMLRNKDLSDKIVKLENDIIDLEKEMRKISKKGIDQKYIALRNKYLNELNIEVFNDIYSFSTFLSLRIKSYSGSSIVKAILVQYLTNYELSLENDLIENIPLIIDTYKKDDFNRTELELVTKFLIGKMSNYSQSFLFMADNPNGLSYLESYKYTSVELKKKNKLLDGDYEEIYKNHSVFIDMLLKN